MQSLLWRKLVGNSQGALRHVIGTSGGQLMAPQCASGMQVCLGMASWLPACETFRQSAPFTSLSKLGTRLHVCHSFPYGTPSRTLAGRNFSAYSLAEPEDDYEGSDSDEGLYEAAGVQPLQHRIGFIGAGQMGEAIIRGFLESGVSSTDRMCASVRSKERHHVMSSLGLQVFGDATTGGAARVAAESDIIVLGVKPLYMTEVLQSLSPHVGPHHLVVSIAAGVKLLTLESALPQGVRVVRVMPNTPCTIRQAASAYVLGTHATEADGTTVHSLMSSVGLAMCVEEHQMDAVTALSGSGPAYVFLAIEALADGGVAAGLPRSKALALAAQTVVGAARMVLEQSPDGALTHPGVLKDKVTSPAGTTIAGLMELESGGVRGSIIKAVKAAADRSRELG